MFKYVFQCSKVIDNLYNKQTIVWKLSFKRCENIATVFGFIYLTNVINKEKWGLFKIWRFDISDTYTCIFDMTDTFSWRKSHLSFIFIISFLGGGGGGHICWKNSLKGHVFMSLFRKNLNKTLPIKYNRILLTTIWSERNVINCNITVPTRPPNCFKRYLFYKNQYLKNAIDRLNYHMIWKQDSLFLVHTLLLLSLLYP